MLKTGESYGTVSHEQENGISEYCQALGIYDKDRAAWLGFAHEDEVMQYLAGGRILDLGSGATERFARELALANEALLGRRLVQAVGNVSLAQYRDICRNSSVFTVNPDYVDAEIGETLIENVTKIAPWGHKSTAALGQALPYTDESFRGIFAYSSLSAYQGPEYDMDAAEQWLGETVRVLEPGGVAFIGPILPNDPRREGLNTHKSWLRLLNNHASRDWYDFQFGPSRVSLKQGPGKVFDPDYGDIWSVCLRKSD